MNMRKKSVGKIATTGGIGILVLGILIQNSYYRGIMEKAGLPEKEEKHYEYQFEMIVSSPHSTFWQDVYKNGRETAEENNVLLELKGTDWETEYDKIDFMNMSIASNADGIIVEYNGEKGLEEKIQEAMDRGIPVVTVMGNVPLVTTQSFVGVSDYQLGVAYGEQVAACADEDTDDILILLRRTDENTQQNQIYTQISKAVLKDAANPDSIRIEGRNFMTADAFETEEAIRDIFQKKSGPPDILVCMDEETTECARQALIDYNMADRVKIIGYYTSENILEAVEKGLIPVTCHVDTQQLGMYSVQALAEYCKEGRASSYYNVDVSFVDRDTVAEYKKKGAFS